MMQSWFKKALWVLMVQHLLDFVAGKPSSIFDLFGVDLRFQRVTLSGQYGSVGQKLDDMFHCSISNRNLMKFVLNYIMPLSVPSRTVHTITWENHLNTAPALESKRSVLCTDNQWPPHARFLPLPDVHVWLPKWKHTTWAFHEFWNRL